jgi:His/Glu/Gln/Arg/opine family amino acid ABC transporter permease subunit
MLQGYSQLIFEGALVTLELALSSVLLAVVIGLIGAGGKLSHNRLLSTLFGAYTTLIRGVPDLVLMLLIFYGLQLHLTTSPNCLVFRKSILIRSARGSSPSGLSTVPISLRLSVGPFWLCRKGR